MQTALSIPPSEPTARSFLTIKDNSDEEDDYRADIAFGVAITSDSKILLTGDYFDGFEITRAFAGRLLSNGSLDTSFGQGGSAELGVGDTGVDDTEGVAIAETSPGTIVAGYIFHSLDYDIGTVVSIAGNSADVAKIGGTAGAEISDILVKPNGRFVVAASEYLSSTPINTPIIISYFSLVGFDAASSSAARDSSFGSAGLTETDFTNSQRATLTGAAIDSEDRIVVAGNLDGQSIVARYTQTGQLDTGFNSTSVLPLGSATITGRVFNDTNANGIFDNTDIGISNFRVFLDANNNNQLDAGEFSTPVSTTGTFHFNNVPAGQYHVEEVARPGWRQTFPAAGYYNLNLAAGQTAKNLTFANTNTALIKGSVFLDANKNHKQDAAEPGLSNWYVYIDINNDNLFDKGDAYTQTDASGDYRFADLTPGTYTVRLAPQSNYTQTAPAAGSFTLTLSAGQTTSHKNFGEKRHA